MAGFVLEIVTPDRKFFEEEVDRVVVRGQEGDLGIMKNHIPLVTPLNIGRIKISQNNEEKEATIAGGYVEVGRDKTTIITDAAEWPEEIDVKRAEESKKRAEERLNKKSSDEVDLMRAEVAFRKALNRINMAKRK
ncbi:F0F1 ATP synthase subunit epsilon [Dethiothermospora halolimnae]|uniref:F0F1 ATP synthase subunit epsilon n=1 Tax=Dethiothermospora halolimnae TaxID=3114390 RepID=UPI003CCC4287